MSTSPTSPPRFSPPPPRQLLTNSTSPPPHVPSPYFTGVSDAKKGPTVMSLQPGQIPSQGQGGFMPGPGMLGYQHRPGQSYPSSSDGSSVFSGRSWASGSATTSNLTSNPNAFLAPGHQQTRSNNRVSYLLRARTDSLPRPILCVFSLQPFCVVSLASSVVAH